MYIDIDRYEPNSANVAQAGYKPGRLQRRRRAAQPGFILVRDCDRGTNSSNQHVPARTHEFRSNNATLTLYAGSNERFSSECIYIYVYIYIYIYCAPSQLPGGSSLPKLSCCSTTNKLRGGWDVSVRLAKSAHVPANGVAQAQLK